MKHELGGLSHLIDGDFIDSRLSRYFSEQGHPALPTRLMAGLHLLKHIHGLSDEEVCERWGENPYFQYFCGEDYFQHRFPIERLSMTQRRRIENIIAKKFGGRPQKAEH